MNTTVWISPSATAYACLCEQCLELARVRGDLFADALHGASVRGIVDLATTVAAIHCPAGHELTLRRVERPPTLEKPDERQLSIA
ncbi:MAG TPA: hypothetical protein VGH52_11885 [Gaiellaceae bacterium]|jgi:hypothetical protein